MSDVKVVISGLKTFPFDCKVAANETLKLHEDKKTFKERYKNRKLVCFDYNGRTYYLIELGRENGRFTYIDADGFFHSTKKLDFKNIDN